MGRKKMLRAARCLFGRFRYRLRNVDRTFLVGGRATLSRDLIAGAYSYVGPGCQVGPGVTIGAYSMLGPGVKVVGNDHVFDRPGVAIIFSGRPVFKKTSIGSDVWIGANAIIIAGVSVGDGAVVAAGSVVTRNIEPLTLVGGVPAKEIRRRFASLAEEEAHLSFLANEPIAGEYCAPLRPAGFL